MTANFKVPFHFHDLGKPEIDAIADVLSGPILTTGEVVAKFEQTFSDYLGIKHTLGVTSCTGALHLSLLALGIGEGDEVITTPQTFIATATAIMESGARPVFVDVEPDTGNIDVSKIEQAITPRTKAIMPVHLYGLMCDMKAIRAIADKHGLKVIEDAAHCIEGVRDGARPGQLSDFACFSFFATKNITCGEGGALSFNDTGYYEKLKLLRLHGMNKTSSDRFKEGYKHWDMTLMGWKYNMDNIQAAMLLPQMARIESNLNKREELSTYYLNRIKNMKGVSFPQTRSGVTHARHLFTIWVSPDIRDQVIQRLSELGVPAVVNYRAIHLLSYFSSALQYKEGSFPNAEKIGTQTLSLPFYPKMSMQQAEYVMDSLESVMKAL